MVDKRDEDGKTDQRAQQQHITHGPAAIQCRQLRFRPGRIIIRSAKAAPNAPGVIERTERKEHQEPHQADSNQGDDDLKPCR